MIILDKANLMGLNKYLGFTEQELEFVICAADKIGSSVELSEFANKAYDLLFVESKPFSEVKEKCYDDLKGFLWLIICISHIPVLCESYEKRGIPQDILIDTLKNIAFRLRKFSRIRKQCCIEGFPWIIACVKGIVYRIGRLEFDEGVFNADARVYTSKHNHDITVIMEAGLHVRKDGYLSGVNGVVETEGFITTLEESENSIIGYEGFNNGQISSNKTVIDLSNYNLSLKKGDKILSVHIPEGDRLDMYKCRDSYKRAIQLWKDSINPEYEIKGFQCCSWLMSPNLSEFLDQSYNIIKFNSSFRKVPYAEVGCVGVFSFVFNDINVDLSKASCTTSLEKKIADYVLSGNCVIDGVGVIPISKVN